MPISLTHDEFIKKLEEKRNILGVAIGYDLKQLKKPTNSPRYMVKLEDGEMELHEFIVKLINNSIYRAVDLVYQDF